jgi:valyl-tRNA synthetase
MMNLEGYTRGPVEIDRLPTEDRWILAALDEAVAATTDDLGAYRFAEATKRLRDFIWGEFCDWYVEFIKIRLRDPERRHVAQRVVAAVLDSLCRLLHPVMPFLAEQVWQPLGELAQERGLPAPRPAEPSVCIAAWPAPIGIRDDDARATVAQWQEKIQAIRNLKAERNVPKEARIAPLIVCDGALSDRLRDGAAFIQSLTNAASVSISATAARPLDAAITVLSDAEVILPLEGLIDRQAECAKMRKALADLDRQLAPVRAKLANEAFVARAPADKVEAERAKLGELEAQRTAVIALIDKDCSS